MPDEIYNLAAQTHVTRSFEIPELTMQVNGVGPLKLFDSIRLCGLARHAKVYQASTSEMFGQVDTGAHNESTTFAPTSPYGSAKLMAHHTAINYRKAYGMFIACGILFNHESPRRGEKRQFKQKLQNKTDLQLVPSYRGESATQWLKFLSEL